MRYRDGIEYAWTTQPNPPEPGMAIMLTPPAAETWESPWTICHVLVDGKALQCIWERFTTMEIADPEPQPGQDTAQ